MDSRQLEVNQKNSKIAIGKKQLAKKSISQFSNMSQPNNPLHGITLEAIVVYLVSFYGWEELGNRIRINCFRNDPSIKSSLKFLRRTPWARQKVEELYLETIRKSEA